MSSKSGTAERISVTDISVRDDKRVEVKFSLTRALKRYFFKESASVTYDTPVAGLPRSLLIIPFLSLIMPVAWVLDAKVEVSEVDAVFAESMERVRRRFQEMYPEVRFAGDLAAGRRVAFEGPAAGRSGTLFSGGIDSHASAIHHRAEPLTLMSIIADRDQNKGFADWITGYNPHFAGMLGSGGHVIRADIHNLFDSPLVCSRVKEHIDDWWSNVQHSLCYTGACAPLAALHGIERFYVPSSHSEGWESIRWCSHPKIDNEIAWGKTHVEHDLYQLGRQKKVALIADFLKQSNATPTLCVCERQKDVGGSNCSQCEKCSRTIVGLALEGLDPNLFGFQLDPARLADIRHRLENGSMVAEANELFFWTDLQRAVDETKFLRRHGVPEFARWFRDTQVKIDEAAAKKHAMYRRLVHFSGALPDFLRRPLREFVLRLRKVHH